MHIEPTREQLQAFAQADQDEPVVMLNLLRFHPDGGLESYLRYAEGVRPHLDRAGGSVLWQGRGRETLIGPDEEWEMVLLVRYPSRKAFLAMVTDPDYLEVSKHRTEALLDSRLIAMSEGPVGT